MNNEIKIKKSISTLAKILDEHLCSTERELEIIESIINLGELYKEYIEKRLQRIKEYGNNVELKEEDICLHTKNPSN